MAEINYKFPMMDDDDKLFDRFPLIVLHMSNGERVELNYFTEYALGYKPTRYMLNNDGEHAFMPIVEYKSYFVSPQMTCKEFISHATARAKQDGGILQVSNNEFINMSNICKIEINENDGDIICFKGKWSDKFFLVDSEPFVADVNDIVIESKKEEIKEVKFDVHKWVDSMNK